ncbi:hypothetical protein [Paenibacillus popilliae]|uniref:Lyzozyme M1 n=1 Tax=Paenibacillus popilliae ATCC 14706 TaxID=1212764 RepID=M9M4R3_PAEPP|nr:hypothetical protein [Paenibacillus popilliae]GAC42293.1 lyzozyme M1 [Paenibacillus popilliae ATCC 14706]
MRYTNTGITLVLFILLVIIVSSSGLFIGTTPKPYIVTADDQKKPTVNQSKPELLTCTYKSINCINGSLGKYCLGGANAYCDLAGYPHIDCTECSP